MRAAQEAALHPAWCSQGRYCDPLRRHDDGELEWAHAVFPFVLGRGDGATDGRADVYLVRMDHVTPTGEHLVHAAAVITADGSMNGEQVREFAAALVRAADTLDEITATVAQATSVVRFGL